MTTKKKTSKKSAKTKSKTAKKPKPYRFEHKAAKGKARVHVIVTVDQYGRVGITHVTHDDDLEYAIGNALDDASTSDESTYDVYHIDQTFAVPKRIVKKATKTRAKKIKTVKPDSSPPDGLPNDANEGAVPGF